MTPYDLVVIDELSLLKKEHFERILRLWRVAERVPTLIFLGDKTQLPGMGKWRAWHSSAWTKTLLKFVHLHQAFRCKDPKFMRILRALRTHKPTKRSRLVERICRKHKAWKGEEPDVQDIKRLLRQHPEAAMVTCRRHNAEKLNKLAIEALFGNKAPLVTLTETSIPIQTTTLMAKCAPTADHGPPKCPSTRV